MENGLPTTRDPNPRTRETLLAKLRDRSDDRSWEEFYLLYWDLIYRTCRAYRLSSAEADEVTQDTLVALTQSLPKFRYDGGKGSFKSWLMHQTRWKVVDFVRRRQRAAGVELHIGGEPWVDDFERRWEMEWRQTLIQAALERLKNTVSPHLVQIYLTCVLDQRGVSETAVSLGISRATVYMAVFRMKQAVKKALRELQKQNV